MLIAPASDPILPSANQLSQFSIDCSKAEDQLKFLNMITPAKRDKTNGDEMIVIHNKIWELRTRCNVK